MSDRIPHRVLDFVADQPWAITEAGLRNVLAIANRENGMVDLEAIAAKLGRPLDNTRTVTIRDGIAIVPIEGTLMKKASLFSMISGGTSYATIASDMGALGDDPNVKAIVGVFDTPGGLLHGCNELAGQIAKMRGKKPLVAYVEGQAASAGYWLACAFDEIVTAPNGELGSIGVVANIADVSKMRAAAGIVDYQFVSSQSPDKRPDLASDRGQQLIQDRVDAHGQIFVEAVAMYRDVDVDDVISDFGGGDVLVGQAAVDAGLADRVGDFESLVAKLIADTKPKNTLTFALAD
jgi:signal peptide peptidase SppA